MDTSLNLNIDAAALLSNDILQELILQSSDRLLGKPYTIITRDLPFADHHILAQNSRGQIVLITFDLIDGGRALLAALAALDHLKQHRAWLFRLYPTLFKDSAAQQRALRVEDIQLIIVAPTVPPGRHFLLSALPQLCLFTFQALSINGEIGLLISDVDGENHRQDTPHHDDAELGSFRPNRMALDNQEEDYFRELNLI